MHKPKQSLWSKREGPPFVPEFASLSRESIAAALTSFVPRTTRKDLERRKALLRTSARNR